MLFIAAIGAIMFCFHGNELYSFLRTNGARPRVTTERYSVNAVFRGEVLFHTCPAMSLGYTSLTPWVWNNYNNS